jgi:glycosyltransferase involved in cell wall biosynthesis
VPVAKSTLVSFVMPIKNEEKHLASAVRSIYEQQLPNGYTREVILAIAPSSDATDAIAASLTKEHIGLQIVANPSGLTSAGLNLAINLSSGEVVVRVDAHSDLKPGYVMAAITELNRDSKIGNVGGVMAAEGETDFEKAVAWAYRSRYGLGGGKFHLGGEAGEVETVYLGVFRRAAIMAAGLFDESVVRGQDWELNQRIRSQGYKVYFTPLMQARYRPRATLLELISQFYRTGLWRGKLSRKDFPNIALKYLAPPALVILTLLWVPLWAYLFVVALIALSAKDIASPVKLRLMLVLPAMHYSWGIGFWLGIAFPSLAKAGE